MNAHPATAPTPRSPAALMARPRFAYWVAFGGGSGLAPWAPGTFGTLWGWLSAIAIEGLLGREAWWMVLPIALLVGIWACSQTAKDLGVPDHGAIVWDEVLAIWLVLFMLPHPSEPWGSLAGQGLSGWPLELLAVVLFRAFDILKPPPIGWMDRRLTGGWGIMADDLMAAFFTLIALSVLLRLLGALA
jgi:phosphatidylglycerophosphatase A